jgi:hypothetical protein
LTITGKGALNAETSSFHLDCTGSAGVEPAAYYYLGLGTSSDNAAASTYTLLGDTSVLSVLTVGHGSSANTEVFDASTRTLTLSGAGIPFEITSKGSFEPSASTVIYDSTNHADVAAVTYNNLSLLPASAVDYSVGSAAALTLRVNGVFVIGDGSAALDLDADTHDPDLDLRGDLTIAANAVYTKGSGIVTFRKGGAQSWTDNSAAKQDLGAVRISANRLADARRGRRQHDHALGRLDEQRRLPAADRHGAAERRGHADAGRLQRVPQSPGHGRGRAQRALHGRHDAFRAGCSRWVRRRPEPSGTCTSTSTPLRSRRSMSAYRTRTPARRAATRKSTRTTARASTAKTTRTGISARKR